MKNNTQNTQNTQSAQNVKNTKNARNLGLIDEINFGELYRSHIQLSHRKSKPASVWDERAMLASRTCGEVTDPYLIELLKRIDTHHAKSLLDIGCGPGTVSIPLAPAFEKVYALDYSAGMLDVLKARAQAQNIRHIECLQHSWDDRGETAWQDVPVCDVVVCSRASMVNDMEDALQKINAKARLRAYMTMTVDPHLLAPEVEACLGRKEPIVGFPNYIYAVNILHQMGYLPQVSYIDAQDCQAQKVENNFERFIKDISWSIGHLSDDEVTRLKGHYDAQPQAKQPLKPQRRVWALLAWDMDI